MQRCLGFVIERKSRVSGGHIELNEAACQKPEHFPKHRGVAACLSRLIVLIAVVQILGGHWMALQSVAWVGMIASYSQSESLGEAISKTFSGKSPCSLCKAVKSGRAEEQKRPSAKLIVKMEAVLSATVHAPLPRADEWEYPVAISLTAKRNLAPPVPPPLAA